MRTELQESETKLVSAADSDGTTSVAGKTQSAAQRLDALLQGTGAVLTSPQATTLIRGVACDSRKAQPQGLFFALQGAKEDGSKFARDAVSRGAVAVVSESVPPPELPESVAWIRVPAARKALAIAAANFFSHPANSLQLTAVTGTNGKTTTTSLIDSIVKASGAKTGLFGTIAYHTPLGDYPAPNTTPESVDLQGFFAEIRDAGGRFAVVEASSHSLMMDRLWGCHFQAAVFTNLTREHMDFHKTFEDYFAAKRRLFEGTGAGPAEVAILNADDEYGPRLSGIAKSSVTYGIENSA
ncbi:MAG TPA: Mur ligase family protein, partial [Candidatus Acidoferrum sp.]|nr:Mur ligase family protein [Candidatus Acidoferrum sp.]